MKKHRDSQKVGKKKRDEEAKQNDVIAAALALETDGLQASGSRKRLITKTSPEELDADSSVDLLKRPAAEATADEEKNVEKVKKPQQPKKKTQRPTEEGDKKTEEQKEFLRPIPTSVFDRFFG